jgi:uncharacterized integral membrane protein
VLGFELAATLTAAWLGAFAAMPYLVPPPAIERLWGNPHLLSFTALAMVALALFLAIGCRSRAQAAGCSAAIFVVVAYSTLIGPLTAMVFLPVLGFFGVIGLTMAKSRTELRWKLIAASAIVLIYFIVFGAWLAGYVLYAKTTFFRSEMYATPVTWNWASFQLEEPSRRPAGVVLLVIAVLGGVLTVLRENRGYVALPSGTSCWSACSGPSRHFSPSVDTNGQVRPRVFRPGHLPTACVVRRAIPARVSGRNRCGSEMAIIGSHGS